MKAIFDECSAGWSKNHEMNVIFVYQQQDYMNELLEARGYVTIMDVFNCLGLPVELARWWSKEFKELCWVYGDGVYIDFGIKPDREKNVIYLDFNIDID